MSARVPDPTRDTIRDALLTVGLFAESLGVEVSPLLDRWAVMEDGVERFTVPSHRPTSPAPTVGVLFGRHEARGWTCLAHWIEHGGHPIERMSRIASAQGWRVTLAGRTWSRSIASMQDHARVAELAAALLVLRRWTTPVRPWGLRDLHADVLDRVQREASVRALPPRPVQVIASEIPSDYLRAHGTAAE